MFPYHRDEKREWQHSQHAIMAAPAHRPKCAPAMLQWRLYLFIGVIELEEVLCFTGEIESRPILTRKGDIAECGHGQR